MSTRPPTPLLLLLLLLGPAGCGANFESASHLSAVRILATQADLPYAAPGDTVTLTTLAANFSSGPSTPVPLAYFPAPCVNPEGDEAANCYPALTSAFTAGVDLTGSLTTGDTFTFSVPADVITTHAAARSGPSYGVVYVFLAACTGHLELVGIDSAFPGSSPFGCFDDQHNKLGTADFVFGFARVYAFDSIRNANPALTTVTMDGTSLDEGPGVTLDHCTSANQSDCPAHAVDSVVDPAEADPVASLPGYPATEEVWVSYFVTGAKMRDDISILYDARAGKLSNTANQLRAPLQAGEYGLWVVAHDSRGGVTWRQFPLHAR